MIFWIVLAVVGLIVLVGVVHTIKGDGWGDHYEVGLAYAGVAASVFLVGVLILSLGGACATRGEPTLVSSTTSELRAIDTGDTLAGRFYFLGGGYINEHRTLEYIKKTDEGYYKVSSEWAEDSRIYEDDTKSPTVTEYKFSYENKFWWPWEIGWATTADFTIPTGSILENYSITNK